MAAPRERPEAVVQDRPTLGNLPRARRGISWWLVPAIDLLASSAALLAIATVNGDTAGGQAVDFYKDTVHCYPTWVEYNSLRGAHRERLFGLINDVLGRRLCETLEPARFKSFLGRTEHDKQECHGDTPNFAWEGHFLHILRSLGQRCGAQLVKNRHYAH